MKWKWMKWLNEFNCIFYLLNRSMPNRRPLYDRSAAMWKCLRHFYYDCVHSSVEWLPTFCTRYWIRRTIQLFFSFYYIYIRLPVAFGWTRRGAGNASTLLWFHYKLKQIDMNKCKEINELEKQCATDARDFAPWYLRPPNWMWTAERRHDNGHIQLENSILQTNCFNFTPNSPA